MLGKKPLNIVAVMRSPSLGELLQAAVKLLNDTKMEVCVGDLRDTAARALREGKPDVLILDLDGDDRDEMAALERIMRTASSTNMPVLVTSASISPSVLRRLLRDGASDFIPQPLVDAEVTEALRSALSRLRSPHSSDVPRGAMITFLRSSGGMGATTLAVHTASSLMRQFRREKPNVCLLDLDLQFGNAALCLDLESGRGLVEIIRSPARLDGALLKAAMAQHKSGLHVLTAPHAPAPLGALHADTVQALLDVARREYEYVVVDLPHALTEWTDPVLTASDLVALVVQLTVPALRQGRRLLELLQEEGYYAVPTAVVVNRYVKKWGASIDLKDAEKALGRPVDYVIPNDYDVVMSALNQGVSVFEAKSQSKFAKQVHEMARAAAQRIETQRMGGTQAAKLAS